MNSPRPGQRWPGVVSRRHLEPHLRLRAAFVVYFAFAVVVASPVFVVVLALFRPLSASSLQSSIPASSKTSSSHSSSLSSSSSVSLSPSSFLPKPFLVASQPLSIKPCGANVGRQREVTTKNILGGRGGGFTPFQPGG